MLTSKSFDYEVQAAQRTLPEFVPKVHLLPGNHDINDLATLQKWSTDYNVSDHQAFSYNGYRFILLNSITLITNLTEFAEHTVREWEWFGAQLEDAAKKGEEIIVAHHHLPFEVTEDEPDNYWSFPNRVRGRYLTLIRKYGVRHILVGHRHETKNIYPTDMAFSIYVVAGTARFFDNNGFGINYFDVNGCNAENDVKQEYRLLEGVTHMKRSEGEPNGCPHIFAV
jgi:3',5'-cyclic AMP phosphodiesterase CpdA